MSGQGTGQMGTPVHGIVTAVASGKLTIKTDAFRWGDQGTPALATPR